MELLKYEHWFSKRSGRTASNRFEDLDYFEDLDNKKAQTKHSKLRGALAGGALGGIVGSLGGKYGAIAGAGVGGYLGHALGKEAKRRNEAEVAAELARYRKATKDERAYLRRRFREKENRRLAEQQLRAQQQTAINTLLW